MARGSHTETGRTFLSVAFGKIRQKHTDTGQRVDENTPLAVRRETQAGKESWALEFDFVSGIIQKIFYKESQEYENTFEVVIADGPENLQLSFTEDSRFWFDFMKKLPNIDLSKEVKITAYDFVDKDKKRRVGISIEQGGTKIGSYYEKKGEDGKWTLLHGFPAADGVDFKDKDETKIYFIKVKKFLKNQFTEIFGDKWGKSETAAETKTDEVSADEPPSDLPF
jgi:hypothetical protein